MKVLHVESGRHLYGGAFQAVTLMRGLTARGIECQLVCRVGAAIAAAGRPHASRVHELAMKGDLDVRTLFRLRALIRSERPDVVHLHSRFGTEIWGALAARAERVAVVHSRRVDNTEPKAWVRIKYRLYDQVVAISEGIRQVLLAEGLAPDHVVCVHSAVETDRYVPDRSAAPAFRAEFGLADTDPVIAIVAQFIPRKGHRTLIDALPRILAEVPRTRVIFFGQGPQEEPMKALVAERGLTDVVRFAGFRNDLPRIVPCLDLVVHPAATEGLGVALLQAASCGVPIVASGVGGIPEVVRDGVTGLLVQPGDVPGLADAVLALLADPARRAACGRAARQHVLDHFSADAMVEGNLAVYRRVLAARATIQARR